MNPELSCDRYCPPAIHATTSMRVNLGSPIGVPVGLGPQEAVIGNTSDGQSRDGVVFLPRGGRKVKMTFKVPPGYDIYASRITCQLWTVTGVAPNRVLGFAPPNDNDGASTTPVDVSLDFYDAGLQIGWSDRAVHWSMVAGDGRRRNPLVVPQCLRGGRTYEVIARNNQGDRDFFISFVFWGRKTRAQMPTGGWTANDSQIYKGLMERLKRDGHLSRGFLKPDLEDAYNNVGLYTVMGLDTVDNAPLALAAGTFDTPATATARIWSGAEDIFMVSQLMARMYADGSDTLVTGNQRAVFAHVFDEAQQEWLTNVPVPIMALCGDGRQPHTLEVEWSWGYKANVNFSLFKMDAGILNLNIEAEGAIRRYHDKLC